MATGIRVLYLPNESKPGSQRGFRHALAKLKGAGLVEDVQVFGLLQRVRDGEGESARQEVLRRVVKFRPSVILLQHVDGAGLRPEHYAAWREAADFSQIYHEVDPYGRILHGLPREAALAGRLSDVTFTSGNGTFRRNFERNGAARVIWTPQVFDPESFGHEPLHPEMKDTEVLMIANRSKATLPLRSLPNAAQRRDLVDRMMERFGDRFAIHGRGWSGPSDRGPVDFWDQGQAISRSWLTVNWDHYAREPKYFSNRLAISLASGSVHFTSRHPGYDEIFGTQPQFLYAADRPVALVDAVDRYLSSTPIERRIDHIRAGREFAQRHLRQDDLLVRMLNSTGAEIAAPAAHDAWRQAVPALSEY